MGNFGQQLEEKQALIYCVTTREYLCSKSAAGHVPLVLTRPVQHMDNSLFLGGHERLSRVSRSPKIQRSSQAMSFLGFLLECCVRDDTKMSLPGRELLIRKLLWIPLRPSEQLIEPSNMLHLRIVVLPLECHCLLYTSDAADE